MSVYLYVENCIFIGILIIISAPLQVLLISLYSGYNIFCCIAAESIVAVVAHFFFFQMHRCVSPYCVSLRRCGASPEKYREKKNRESGFTGRWLARCLCPGCTGLSAERRSSRYRRYRHAFVEHPGAFSARLMHATDRCCRWDVGMESRDVSSVQYNS